MKVFDLYKYLDSAIPTSLSCTWDNDGLMCCSNPEKEVKKVLITLDITEKAVDYAAENGFDVILSHHPLIFKKLGSIEPGIGSAKKAIKLIKNEITAISFHTRLDALTGGVNDALCKKLSIRNPQPFGPDGEQMGRIGNFDAPMTVEEVCARIKTELGSPVILASACGKPAHRVAVLGGDGKDFTHEAIKAGADTYISGRIGYNMMMEAAELGINLIEAGHFFTEDPVCEALARLTKTFLPSAATEIFHSNEIKVL